MHNFAKDKNCTTFTGDYEDHELEDASDLIPLLLSTQKIKGRFTQFVNFHF